MRRSTRGCRHVRATARGGGRFFVLLEAFRGNPCGDLLIVAAAEWGGVERSFWRVRREVGERGIAKAWCTSVTQCRAPWSQRQSSKRRLLVMATACIGATAPPAISRWQWPLIVLVVVIDEDSCSIFVMTRIGHHETFCQRRNSVLFRATEVGHLDGHFEHGVGLALAQEILSRLDARGPLVTVVMVMMVVRMVMMMVVVVVMMMVMLLARC